MKYNLALIFLLNTLLLADNPAGIHLWHAEKFNRKISDKLSIALEQDLRSESSLYYVHSDFGFKYKIGTRWAFNINFREVFENKKGVWVSEHRPHGTVSTNRNFGALNVSARSRIEYRIKQDKDPVFRNRDMVTIKFGQGFTALKIIPYIADEIFYDFENKKLNRNRAYVGITIKSVPYLSPTIYLMNQSDFKENRWNSFLILGFKFNF
ncbi:MAG: DUF2490 domain-containing protein [Candidatus Marinimicrobia bacterium]|nr:DUF2490 domain-containing protein [Candidatus Neomarinimicrobiota bacterium]